MRNKLGLGAGFALTAAVIAIGGCSGKKSSNIIAGTSSELGGNNGFPASSIASNNLAADTGGFSENNQTASFTFFNCKFNFKHAESDAPKTAADGSGMFFFVTTDNGTSPTHPEHVYASYYNGSSFTPPQELTAADRDESQTVGVSGGKNTHPAAAVLMPMNTSGYLGANGQSNARVRANNGNWVIFWDGNTFTQNQQLVQGGAGNGILTADAVGPHHTVFVTVFIKNLASQALANTTLIGNTAASGTANGPSIECHYGFQAVGSEAVSNRNGLAVGAAAALNGGRGAAFVNNANNIIKPAEDVASFGVASDTIVHCANYTATTTSANDDLSGLLSGGTAIGNLQTGTTPGASLLGPNSGAGSNAFPGTASYEVGDDTSFIQLFYTQLVTSGTGLTRQSTTFSPTASTGTVQLGPTWSFFTANFNLATMTIGGTANPNAPTGQAVVNAPATRNTFSDGRRASTQVNGNFTTYNNLVFWSYDDVSLAVAQTGAPGTQEAEISSIGPNRGSRVLSVVAVIAGSNGDATIANQNDVTLLGSAGRHSIVNSTPPGSTSPVDQGEEQVLLGLCNGCGILGPD